MEMNLSIATDESFQTFQPFKKFKTLKRRNFQRALRQREASQGCSSRGNPGGR